MKKDLKGGAVIPISRLHLDLENYRHLPVASEAEAISELCRTEKILELAQDIVERGTLSPLEVLGVVPMEGNPGHFIAVEGNRRTCALILAADPARAPEFIRAQMRRVSAGGSAPREALVHVFSDRSEAQQWVELRHLGEQNGAGTKAWNPTQKNRAAEGNAKSTAQNNTLAVAVLDRLVAIGLLTMEQRARVPLSTITRYLGTPGVRAVLGLASPRQLIYSYEDSQVDSALLRLVLDSINQGPNGSCDVSSRSDSSARLKYANKLKSEGLAPVTAKDEPSVPSLPAAEEVAKLSKGGSSLPQGAARPRNAPDPDRRRFLLPPDFKVNNRDPVLSRIRREAASLEVDNFAFSANYLLRALVEQILVLFAKKQGVWKKTLSDQALTLACAEELKKCGVSGKPYTIVSKAGGSQDQPHSLHSLGNAVHGGVVPTAINVRRHFDTWRPALEEILKLL